jgi:hypothetical protein
MTPNAAMMFAIPIMIFACGMALLSYRFYAAYHAWAFKEFGYRAHLPGILGTALMLFAIVFASSLGWSHAVVTVLGGVAISYLYVYVFRMWTGAALLGPVFAALSILLMPA